MDFRYFLSQALYIGQVFSPDVQPGGGLGSDWDQPVRGEDSQINSEAWTGAPTPLMMLPRGGQHSQCRQRRRDINCKGYKPSWVLGYDGWLGNLCWRGQLALWGSSCSCAEVCLRLYVCLHAEEANFNVTSDEQHILWEDLKLARISFSQSSRGGMTLGKMILYYSPRSRCR